MTHSGERRVVRKALPHLRAQKPQKPLLMRLCKKSHKPMLLLRFQLQRFQLQRSQLQRPLFQLHLSKQLNSQLWSTAIGSINIVNINVLIFVQYECITLRVFVSNSLYHFLIWDCKV
jgi:hypothetical protein